MLIDPNLEQGLVVGPPAQQPLLLQLDQESLRLLRNEVDHSLVVFKLDRGPVQAG